MGSHDQKNNPIEPEALFSLTLNEVTRSFGVSVETIIAIVEEGIVNVPVINQDEWVFDTLALKKIRTVIHLKKDLGVNYPGAALILELLDEIERLRLMQ